MTWILRLTLRLRYCYRGGTTCDRGRLEIGCAQWIEAKYGSGRGLLGPRQGLPSKLESPSFPQAADVHLPNRHTVTRLHGTPTPPQRIEEPPPPTDAEYLADNLTQQGEHAFNFVPSPPVSPLASRNTLFTAPNFVSTSCIIISSPA